MIYLVIKQLKVKNLINEEVNNSLINFVNMDRFIRKVRTSEEIKSGQLGY